MTSAGQPSGSGATPKNRVYWFWRRFSRLLYDWLFKLRVHGAENVPLTGGLVLAGNHASFLDPHGIAVSCPRMVHSLARKSLFCNPVAAAIMRSWKAVPVDLSGKADIAGIKTLVDLLQRGEAVVLFPEGTRTWDGNFLPPRPGVGMLVAKANVPVVPVRVFGSYEAWPRTRKWFRRGQLDIVFGAPVHYEQMIAEAKAQGPRAVKEVYQKIAADVLERIKAIPMP
ncbi:MAG: 1-acyl-sn-glycerol-3-phosphate acyltransferase [Verrucomicrobia bacterium]|nr:1-acyl-sn-glycerol-3-phosphate acyltransferase [Verrucomicrobiota bacterium]